MASKTSVQTEALNCKRVALMLHLLTHTWTVSVQNDYSWSVKGGCQIFTATSEENGETVMVWVCWCGKGKKDVAKALGTLKEMAKEWLERVGCSMSCIEEDDDDGQEDN